MTNFITIFMKLNLNSIHLRSINYIRFSIYYLIFPFFRTYFLIAIFYKV